MTVNLSHFAEPPSEREVLRYALNNILTEYAKKHDAFPFDPEEPKLETLTDHRINFGGNYSQLESRLMNRFDGTSFKVNATDQRSIDELKDALEDPSASYPLVEVDPELYEYQAENADSEKTYVVQNGHHDEALVPLLIPFSIEEGQVFYYDPFLHFYINGNVPTQNISRGLFIELWGRCDLTSWAFWVDQGQQLTLTDINKGQL